MKQGILDVKVILHDGTRINLEMQLRRQKFWEKRSLYYLAKMYVDTLLIGENFDRLRRCIGISILDFNLTEDGRYHSVYRMRDEMGKDYSDLLELHIIELRKTLSGNSRVDDWIRLFNAKTEEDLHMIRTKNAGVEKAKYVIREMSLTESLREAAEYYRKKRMDRKSEDAYVYDQGKEAGEQLGMERGIEIGQERGIEIGRETLLLDLHTKVFALVLELDDVDDQLEGFPQQPLVILTQLSTHIQYMLESLLRDVTLKDDDVRAMSASLEGMEYNFEEVSAELKSALAASYKNRFTVIKGQKKE